MGHPDPPQVNDDPSDARILVVYGSFLTLWLAAAMARALLRRNAVRSMIGIAALALAVTVCGSPYVQKGIAAGLTAPVVDPRAIAERIAVLLEAEYLYADTGKDYAARMRERAAHGAYDGLTGAALAERLTLDLLAVKEDRHLRVRFGAPMMRMAPGADAGGATGSLRTTAMPSAPAQPAEGSVPQAIETGGWIAPGIAFIRFNQFPHDAAGITAICDFLRAHANATTLIFDLRTNHGGGPDLLDALFPMLFDHPARLFGSEARGGMETVALAGPNLRTAKGAPSNVREYWVTPAPPSPLQHARLIVLTSPASASGAEVFSAALKWSGRGTIIGAQTAGANHAGALEMLDGGLSLFVPVGRVFNPADGKDWEGVGIAPDVAVAPEEALTTALTRAGLPRSQAASLAEQYRPTQPMTRRQQVSTGASAPANLPKP